jgi:hypothetical protein
MNRFRHAAFAAAFGLVAMAAVALAQEGSLRRIRPDRYQEAIHRTANMVNDPEAQRLARERGLNVLNLTWEDTGRYKSSSLGPNISDMTIQVAADRPGKGYEVKCMPVIRFPNYSDKTADIDPRDFTLLVGNEKGKNLRRISLYEFLEHPDDFLHNPNSWPGRDHSLLADRDDLVLASAQACFLPVPQRGKATFNPVLFNYQSVSGDPAVLTILATREGSSVTVIDNKRDAFAEGAVWGQRLFHQANGKRASLTGQRESDFNRRQGSIGPGEDIDKRRVTTSSKKQANLNMVLLIQVPLKQKDRPRRLSMGGAVAPAAVADYANKSSYERSNVENAVIGHGALEGPFTEIDHLPIVRDERFPVRVTVQFYKATSNGVVDEKDLDSIKSNIDWVYSHGDAVGSLVTDGETGRATEYWGMKVQPRNWWNEFWERYEDDQGVSRETARRRLAKLLGNDYMRRPVCDLYLRDQLRKSG